MPIHSEYFSLIFGILFLVFIVLIYLNFHQLHILVDKLYVENSTNEIIAKIKFVAWIGSPFYMGKQGLYTFSSLIGLGLVYSLILGVSHLFLTIPKDCHITSKLFRFIGAFDVIVFCISATLIFYLLKYVMDIRHKIGL